MFLDASSIIVGESETAKLAAWPGQAVRVMTSLTAVLDRFLAEVTATVAPIDAARGREAISALDRLGKARPAASLTPGGCFAHVRANVSDALVLCKGNDFPQMDIGIA